MFNVESLKFEVESEMRNVQTSVRFAFLTRIQEAFSGKTPLYIKG